MGRVALRMVESLLQNALRSADTNAKINSSSEGVVTLDWPKIDINLAKIAEVRRVKDATIMGLGVFSFLELGPVTVEDKHARLKIGWSAEQEPAANSESEDKK